MMDNNNHKTYFYYLCESSTSNNEEIWVVEESPTPFDGYVEESLADTKPLDHFQFIRNGYYCTDKDSVKGKLVFNRTCGLKSSFKL